MYLKSYYKLFNNPFKVFFSPLKAVGLISWSVLRLTTPSNWTAYKSSYLGLHTLSGVYIKLEIHIPPPPSWFIFFPQLKFILGGCARMGKLLSPFFAISSQLGKKFAYFLPMGEKYAFPPFFHPLSIIFTPNLLFGHIPPPPPRGANNPARHRL